MDNINKDQPKSIKISDVYGPNFTEGEFNPPLTIEKLCKAIVNGNYNVPIQAKSNTIEWLNELLNIPNFYDVLHVKKPKKDFPKSITNLIKKTNAYRDKKFSGLNYDEQHKIKSLNPLLLEETYPQETPKSGGKNSNLKKVLADLPSIWQLPFKLITTAGIDGGGKGAWETMVRRTQTMFNSPEEFEENPQLSVSDAEREKAIEEASKRVIPRSTGALSKCMEKLRPILEVPNGYKGYEVVLIGHSMGTIVMNEILHRYSTFSFNHIVYMGAACSINDFRVNGIPSLIKHNKTKFYNLCLHPLAEQQERQGKGFIPRGSLLEWLDNFLTAPNTTLDRRMGKWENIVRTTSVIPNEVRSRVTLKAFELCKSKGNSQKADECKGCHSNPSQKPPKNPGNPQGHGEFTEQNFWEKDFWNP